MEGRNGKTATPPSDRPHVYTGCERFGAEQRQEAPAFDISPTPSKPNPFEELAATLVEYDTVDLLSAVAALQFLPQNASRVTRLEAFAHSVASLRLTAGPRISSSRFRRTCVHRSLEELAYAEDPAENVFTEEFTFFGGPFLLGGEWRSARSRSWLCGFA